MDSSTRAKIVRCFGEQPEGMRFRPATPSQLAAFEQEFGPIPTDHRWFLAHCGGGVVGSEWVDGIEGLADTHHRFRTERAQGYWSLLDGVFVIGLDGGGNYYGIDTANGRILVQDHDFGGLHELARSYEEFLLAGIVENPR